MSSLRENVSFQSYDGNGYFTFTGTHVCPLWSFCWFVWVDQCPLLSPFLSPFSLLCACVHKFILKGTSVDSVLYSYQWTQVQRWGEKHSRGYIQSCYSHMYQTNDFINNCFITLKCCTVLQIGNKMYLCFTRLIFNNPSSIHCLTQWQMRYCFYIGTVICITYFKTLTRCALVSNQKTKWSNM